MMLQLSPKKIGVDILKIKGTKGPKVTNGPKVTTIILAFFIPAALLIYSIIYNCRNATCSIWGYFNTPIYAIINMVIAIGFAYFLTQIGQDKRKRKQLVEKYIDKIVITICDEKMYNITQNEDINRLRITQRTIYNWFSLLQEYQVELGYSDTLEEIKDIFDNYWKTISDNINNIDYLNQEKQKMELCNYIKNMESRLERIIVSINQ